MCGLEAVACSWKNCVDKQGLWTSTWFVDKHMAWGQARFVDKHDAQTSANQNKRAKAVFAPCRRCACACVSIVPPHLTARHRGA